MAKTVIVHLANEEPFVGEIDQLPGEHCTNITVLNPRKRDGKPLHYLASGVTSMILPWTRVSFIEVVTTAEERRELVEFFRES